MTTRGFTEEDFRKVAAFVDRAVDIAKKLDEKVGGKKLLKDFMALLGNGDNVPEVVELRREVSEMASKYDLPWVEGGKGSG